VKLYKNVNKAACVIDTWPTLKSVPYKGYGDVSEVRKMAQEFHKPDNPISDEPTLNEVEKVEQAVAHYKTKTK
jgi:hypothetical protein